MYDIWNKEQELAREIYRKNNFLIFNNSKRIQGKTCYIFFSSNNIWYPNTVEAFRRSFIDNDYFEWIRYSKVATKTIFVRDIYKSWYVTGINEQIDSVEKLILFLKHETDGFEIVTVGSSAGGYMAALIGAILNAKYALVFSGQFTLNTDGALGTNPFLGKFNDSSRKKYYDATPYIRKSQCSFFYFMPVHSKTDQEQYEYVADIDNILILKFASSHHGVPIPKCNLERILSMEENELINVYEKYKNKNINPLFFSIKISGVKDTFFCTMDQIRKKLNKR